MRNDIFKEIDAERARQEVKWGDTDQYNNLNDWTTYINAHATKWFPGGLVQEYGSMREVNDAFRAQMVKVAALAVAAIENIDNSRNRKAA